MDRIIQHSVSVSAKHVISRLTSGDGIYFQPCIHPEGTHVVYYGNSSGPPRIWKADLTTGEIVALTPSETNARHPVFDWKGERIAFSSDFVFNQKHETVEEMTPSGDSPANSLFNIFVMDTDGKNVKQITKGRGSDEHVRRVATFSSSAFRCEEGFQPLLILGEGFRSWMPEEYNKFPPGTPNIDVAGWYQGGVRTYGEGRIAFLQKPSYSPLKFFRMGV